MARMAAIGRCAAGVNCCCVDSIRPKDRTDRTPPQWPITIRLRRIGAAILAAHAATFSLTKKWRRTHRRRPEQVEMSSSSDDEAFYDAITGLEEANNLGRLAEYRRQIGQVRV